MNVNKSELFSDELQRFLNEINSEINKSDINDVTYYADITLFLHATSGGLSPTEAFSVCWFLAFHCFKCYMASFPRYKPNIMPPKHAEQDQIDAKG